MWRELLDFNFQLDRDGASVKDIVSGKTFHRPMGGFDGEANVGMDESWLGHPLAMANLYGFGRLAWNPDLSPRAIADDRARPTFGNHPAAVTTLSEIQIASSAASASYTVRVRVQP